MLSWLPRFSAAVTSAVAAAFARASPLDPGGCPAPVLGASFRRASCTFWRTLSHQRVPHHLDATDLPCAYAPSEVPGNPVHEHLGNVHGLLVIQDVPKPIAGQHNKGILRRQLHHAHIRLPLDEPAACRA